MYTLKEPYPGVGTTVDHFWTATEAQLPIGISQLQAIGDDCIPADLWLHCLVPYVTELFVRGDVFKYRFESQPLVQRLQASSSIPIDNTNLVRLMARKRLYYAVMDAHWWILRNHTSVPFIINDIGMTAAIAPDDQPGYAIPLNAWVGVMLSRGPAHNRLVWEEGSWQVEGIGQHMVTVDDHMRLFNSAIFGHALRECYSGLEKPLIEASAGGYQAAAIEAAAALGPAFLIHSEQWLRDNEMAYFHFLSVIAEPPEDESLVSRFH